MKDIIITNFKKVEQSILTLIHEKKNCIPLLEKNEYSEKDLARYDTFIMRFERALEIVCNIFFRVVEISEYGVLSKDTKTCLKKMKNLSLISSEDLWIKMIMSRSDVTSSSIQKSRVTLCNEILTHYIDELEKFYICVKKRYSL